MADHDTTPELYYDGQWNAAPVYTRDGIALSRGAGGEGQEAPPSSAALTLDNRTGDYNPRNPTSPLYGLVGRNTPLRVSVDGSVRCTVEIASWAPQRAIKGDAWTPVVGGGILRRLGQGKTPLKSPMERAIRASSPVAFWPMNEGAEATALLSGLPDGQAITLSGISPGQIDGPIGAVAKYPNFAAVNGVLGHGSALAPTGLSATGWGFEALVYIGDPVDPALSYNVQLLHWNMTGQVTDTVLDVGVLNAGGGPYVSLDIDAANGSNYGALAEYPDVSYGWNHVRVLVYQDGSDATSELYVNGVLVDGDTEASTTVTVPAGMLTIGRADTILTEDNAGSAGLGMLAFYDLADAADHSDAATAHVGERAGVRFLRLADEEGIAASVVGDENDTQPMGPQPVAALLEILRECVRTDSGLLFEPRDSLAVVMRTGRDLYNQDPVLTLDFSTAGISTPFAPLLDDQGTRNDVTAKRPNGSSFRAVRTTGPLNVNDPTADPQGVGRYDHEVSVNTSTDTALVSQAHWHLHRGTVDETRYPQIVVDVDALVNAGLTATVTAVDAVDIGDRIAVTGLPVDWQQGDASLIVLGIRESLPPKRRLVTFVCIPASQFEVGIVGANDGSTNLRGTRVGTNLSTLAAGVTRYATSLSVATSGGVLWTTSSNAWDPARNGGGLFIAVGGEQMRVTNITGASSPQTFAVVRSTNGVVKTHDSGAQVRVAYPLRVGL